MNTSQTLGEIDFGPGALIDLDAYVLAFLDEHVRGIHPDPPPRRCGSSSWARRWRDAQAWPPPGSAPAVFHFSSDGRANSRFGGGR